MRADYLSRVGFFENGGGRSVFGRSLRSKRETEYVGEGINARAMAVSSWERWLGSRGHVEGLQEVSRIYTLVSGTGRDGSKSQG